MTGLDKILEKINSDSDLICSGIEARAKKQCEEIAAKAEKDGAELALKAEKKAVSDAEIIITMAESSASQISRQTLLSAKVEAVNETLSSLISALCALPADKYFPAVVRLAGDNAMPGKCTAFVGKRDLERLPADFGKDLKEALAEKGAECVLSDKPCEIESGVFLDYGNIAIDCSFEAVIEENSDIYKEKISEIIF